MIERIPDQIQVQTGEWRGTTFDIIPKETFAMACRKINELADAINKLETMAKNTNTVLESLVEENNIHEKQIDELQMKVEPEKCEPQAPYAEQRGWIGKLCRFWDDNEKEWVIDFLRAVAYGYADTPYRGNKDWYEHCEPVKPDDDIIYKGGDNE